MLFSSCKCIYCYLDFDNNTVIIMTKICKFYCEFHSACDIARYRVAVSGWEAAPALAPAPAKNKKINGIIYARKSMISGKKKLRLMAGVKVLSVFYCEERASPVSGRCPLRN